MQRFRIADLLLEVTSDNICTANLFEAFSSPDEHDPDLKIHLNNCSKIQRPIGETISVEDYQWVHNSNIDKTYAAYIEDKLSNNIISMAELNTIWTSACISFDSTFISEKNVLTGPMGQFLFRNFILHHQGIAIHSSAIDLNGKGILFSAPSGTGKSTQANLWKIHKGAKILNGDRPVVRVLNNQPYVYGTPWSGSSLEFLNSNAPLSAIVMLEQSTKNSIYKLTNQEAVSKLMPRCFLPYHDSNLMSIAIKNLEKIINNTPIYLLKCRADKEAVELTYKSIL
jgi:hypothetical protein